MPPRAEAETSRASLDMGLLPGGSIDAMRLLLQMSAGGKDVAVHRTRLCSLSEVQRAEGG